MALKYYIYPFIFVLVCIFVLYRGFSIRSNISSFGRVVTSETNKPCVIIQDKSGKRYPIKNLDYNSGDMLTYDISINGFGWVCLENVKNANIFKN